MLSGIQLEGSVNWGQHGMPDDVPLRADIPRQGRKVQASDSCSRGAGQGRTAVLPGWISNVFGSFSFLWVLLPHVLVSS